MEQNAILSTVSRIIKDEEFRNWFASNPREALVTLGLPRTAIDSLVRVAPILVAVAVSGVLLEPPGGSTGTVGYRDR